MQPLVSAGKLFEPKVVGEYDFTESLLQPQRQRVENTDQNVSRDRNQSDVLPVKEPRRGSHSNKRGSHSKNRSMVISETDDEEIASKVRSLFKFLVLRVSVQKMFVFSTKENYVHTYF